MTISNIKDLPQELIPKNYKPYIPKNEDRIFSLKIWNDFTQDKNIKEMAQPLLSNRSLKTFWDDSAKDYTQFVIDKTDDWMREYPSAITRDKVNTFLSALVQKLISPQLFAQNKQQNIDKSIAQAMKPLLEYAVENDGYPFDSGHSKFVRSAHKCLIEGTMHKLIFINEEKEHETYIIPNEEVYIQNFYQFDIQKQPHFLWVQDNVSYEEAKSEFNKFDNFKYVIPGVVQRFSELEPALKNYDAGIVQSKRVQIIRAWYAVPEDRLNGRKRAKYFNIWINGVLMLPYDNLDIYRHGYFPITKTIFELLDSHFYWGNSLPNKLRHDKKWSTALRTITTNRGKLTALPPMFAEDGLNIDQDIYVPSKITSITGKADQLKEVPGIAPISNADFELIKLAEDSADKGSVAPITQGLPSEKQRTLGEIQLQEANATRLMSLTGLMIAFGVEQDSYLILQNVIQFYPRKKINNLAKISIPNQQLSSGKTGTIEIIFTNVLDLSEEERLKKSQEMALEELKASKSGDFKEIKYIDPSYASNLKWFVKVVANPVERQSKAMERYEATATYKEIYFNNPNINQSEAIRRTIRQIDPEAEDALVLDQPTMPQGQMPQLSQMGAVPPKI